MGMRLVCRIRSAVPRPTEWVSPNRPKGSSALRCPRRIFSSFGKGGKNSGGGGWPGIDISGIWGGADVNALRLCAYASNSGYGSAARERTKAPFSSRQKSMPAKSCTLFGFFDRLHAFISLLDHLFEFPFTSL